MDTKEMDCSGLLFAYHVRELAMKRLVHGTPEGLTAEAATQYMFERFAPPPSSAWCASCRTWPR